LREISNACAKIIAGNLKGKEIEIEVDIPLSTPRLLGDVQSIRQILLNLLGNLVKFTPDGGQVRISTETDATGRLALIITDNGIGIAKSELPHITEPFR
jgi:signal transduction histidine kinase